VVTLIHRSGTMVLPFLAVYVTVELGMDVRFAGLYLGAYGVGGALGAIVGGWLADRIGNVRAMLATLLGAGIGFAALGVVEDPWQLAVVLTATGMAAEGFRTPSSAEIGAAAATALRARAFALRRLAINLGMTSGPAIGGVLATINYTWLFAVDSATCVAAALCAAVVLGRDATADVDDDVSEATDQATVRVSLDPRFAAVLAAAGLVTLAFGQLFGAYPLTLKQDFGHSETVIGAMLALNTSLIIAFEMVVQHRLSGVAQPRVAAIGCVILAVGFALVPIDPRIAFLALAMTVMTIAEMLIYPAIESHVVALAPRQLLSRAVGRLHAVFSGVFVLAPVVGLWIYDGYGYRNLWLTAAATTALSAIAFALVSRGTAEPAGAGAG
jgi:MFS family permease